MAEIQTSVEWLYQRLWDEPKDKFTWYAIREKALKMEEEQRKSRREINTDKITRFEVIDENGRVYSRHNVSIEPSIQDDGRTMKVFVNEKK